MENQANLQSIQQEETPAQSPGAAEKLRSIGELAQEFGITLRALRFYQNKGLLIPSLSGLTRSYNSYDAERLSLILQGKRLGFTLYEIRQMLARPRNPAAPRTLPMSRKACIEQIALLERQQRETEDAIVELRRIYTEMFVRSGEPAKSNAA